MNEISLIIPGMTGPGEVILLLLVILLLFGAKRLPELARALGKSLGEFRKGREEGEKKVSSDVAKKDDEQGKGEGPAA